jgi:hypothetical protein
MATDQDASNDLGEDDGVIDYDSPNTDDINGLPTTTPPAIIEDPANPPGEDYADDEELPDVTVNLVINDDLPGGATLPSDLVDAGLTDIYGNPITSKPWTDSIDDYTKAITQGITDELITNGTDTASGKGFWGKFFKTKISCK